MDRAKMKKERTKNLGTVFKVTLQLETFLASFLVSPAVSYVSRIQKGGEILEMIWIMTVPVRHRVGWLVALNQSCFIGRLFLRHSPTTPWFPR